MNREPAGEQFGATFQETCSTVTWWSSWFEAIFGKILDSWCIFKPLKTNIEPENGPLEEDIPFLETHHFSGFMLNFGKCTCPKNKYPKRNQTRIAVVVSNHVLVSPLPPCGRWSNFDEYFEPLGGSSEKLTSSFWCNFCGLQIFDPFHSHGFMCFCSFVLPSYMGITTSHSKDP